MKKQETSEEWEARYIKNIKITKEEYDKNFITTPCYCEYFKCTGWIAERK